MDQDLLEDIEEFAYLRSSAERCLERLRPHLAAHANIDSILNATLERYRTATTHDELRSLQGITAALMTAIDWQSPSFLHSIKSQAGTQAGRIVGTVNDYKRDQNLDAEEFEIAFAKEYIDAPLRMRPNVYATVSGMSAFTTVINFLQHNDKTDGAILVGQNSYFENKGLLKKTFPNRVRFVDEMNIEAILEAVSEHKPSVIFLDTLCNTETVAMPNLAELFPALAKIVKRHTYIVLDNSGMGPMCQPLKNFPRLCLKLHLIVFESLNKFYQFGMDRVTGGIIWGVGNDTLGITSMRTHLGTNIPDASARAMPEPNRKLLDRRMKRIDRNAQFMAEALDSHIRSRSKSPLSHVTYPGLSSYQDYAWTKDLNFHGAFLVLNFKSPNQIVRCSKYFLSITIEEAKKADVELVAGTSFGFNTTRVYLTALKAQKDATPFLRISVGTEQLNEIQKLIELFKRSIDRL